MRIFKRFFWSITQQKSKYFLLFFSSFVLGLIFTGILVLSFYMKNVQVEFIENYGAQVSIYNSEQYHNRFMNRSIEYNNIEKANKVIKQMFNDENVKYADYSYLFKGLQSKELHFKYSSDLENEDVYFWGTQKSKFLDLQKNKIKIVDGRSFSQEEINQGLNVMVISKEVQVNGKNIKVGDKIKLLRNLYPINLNSNSTKDITYSEEVEYEVIGLFEVDELYQVKDENTIDNYETRVYVPNNTIQRESKRFEELNFKYNNDHSNMNNSFILGDAYFLLKTANQLHKFEEKYEDLFKGNVLPKGYFVYGTKDVYEKISKPIKAISTISDYLLYVSSICCVLILSAIIFIVTKNRKKEIGILLSLGEMKSKIFIQILFEILIVGLIGLNLSIVSGIPLGNQLTKYMIDSTIVDYSEVLSNEENETQMELLENYKVDLSIEYITYVNQIGCTVLLIASSISLINMMNTSPKRILQEEL